MNAQLVTSATGKYTTHCKLCRRAVAESPALDIPIIGQPDKRTLKVIGLLGKHLSIHHSDEFTSGKALADLVGQELIPFLILSTFHHQDPSVMPRLEVLRAPLFAVVRKNVMPDEDLKTIIAALGLSGDDDEKVLAAMRTVRDACCEFGQFASKISTPSPLVTP